MAVGDCPAVWGFESFSQHKWGYPRVHGAVTVPTWVVAREEFGAAGDICPIGHSRVRALPSDLAKSSLSKSKLLGCLLTVLAGILPGIVVYTG